MAAKPAHKGHIAAINKASSECDEVHVFVSLGDRIRPKEVPVYGSDMEIIWKSQLENIMPPNVVIEYVKVPVASAYDFAGQIDKSDTDAMVIFYADDEDLAKIFPEDKMSKYVPNLGAKGRVEGRITQRLFSGTKMRQMLGAGDVFGFKKMLPDGIDKELVWDLLSTAAAKPILAKVKKPVKKTTKLESRQPSLKRLIFT